MIMTLICSIPLMPLLSSLYVEELQLGSYSALSVDNIFNLLELVEKV
jgi:hypothetical protein